MSRCVWKACNKHPIEAGHHYYASNTNDTHLVWGALCQMELRNDRGWAWCFCLSKEPGLEGKRRKSIKRRMVGWGVGHGRPGRVELTLCCFRSSASARLFVVVGLGCGEWLFGKKKQMLGSICNTSAVPGGFISPNLSESVHSSPFPRSTLNLNLWSQSAQ